MVENGPGNADEAITAWATGYVDRSEHRKSKCCWMNENVVALLRSLALRITNGRPLRDMSANV